MILILLSILFISSAPLYGEFLPEISLGLGPEVALSDDGNRTSIALNSDCSLMKFSIKDGLYLSLPISVSFSSRSTILKRRFLGEHIRISIGARAERTLYERLKLSLTAGAGYTHFLKVNAGTTHTYLEGCAAFSIRDGFMIGIPLKLSFIAGSSLIMTGLFIRTAL